MHRLCVNPTRPFLHRLPPPPEFVFESLRSLFSALACVCVRVRVFVCVCPDVDRFREKTCRYGVLSTYVQDSRYMYEKVGEQWEVAHLCEVEFKQQPKNRAARVSQVLFFEDVDGREKDNVAT